MAYQNHWKLLKLSVIKFLKKQIIKEHRQRWDKSRPLPIAVECVDTCSEETHTLTVLHTSTPRSPSIGRVIQELSRGTHAEHSSCDVLPTTSVEFGPFYFGFHSPSCWRYWILSFISFVSSYPGNSLSFNFINHLFCQRFFYSQILDILCCFLSLFSYLGTSILYYKNSHLIFLLIFYFSDSSL